MKHLKHILFSIWIKLKNRANKPLDNAGSRHGSNGLEISRHADGKSSRMGGISYRTFTYMRTTLNYLLSFLDWSKRSKRDSKTKRSGCMETQGFLSNQNCKVEKGFGKSTVFTKILGNLPSVGWEVRKATCVFGFRGMVRAGNTWTHYNLSCEANTSNCSTWLFIAATSWLM
jgi:hypothetical protein